MKFEENLESGLSWKLREMCFDKDKINCVKCCCKIGLEKWTNQFGDLEVAGDLEKKQWNGSPAGVR